ncbi:sulfatase-like hydrolase/transferase [Fibrobacter sp.]|uniref:sulfatase-like hydrolase/transferase n=1 Tax=Fibrobacter sp. TaxID=35828 RepID=UPI0025BDC339|nr:sulfatase-like hydrolase/transferase [Fibrobacter sp.]MBR3072903.1 sulfatase-like hydrolase/transferase [Fibrobacter sp.]
MSDYLLSKITYFLKKRNKSSSDGYTFYLLFIPILTAILPYSAVQFFDTPVPHGFFSAETFILLLALVTPQWQITYKIPFVAIALGYGFWMGTDDAWAYSILCIALIAITIVLPRKKILLSIFYGLCILVIFAVDCENFFYYTFSLHIRDVWNLALFYWWGVLLFILTLFFQIALAFYFFRKIQWTVINDSASHKKALFLFVILFSCNAGINEMQSRQPIMDFPIKHLFSYNIFLQHFEDTRSLDETTKNTFKSWNNSKEIASDFNNTTVMILIESWGVNKNSLLTAELFSVFDSCNKSFVGIKKRDAAHTQGAEWEDFCIPSCNGNSTAIPQKFKAAGLKTIYLHGYNGDFYNRERMYSNYGFDTLLFHKELSSIGLSSCKYGFEGICDSSVVNYIDFLLSDTIPKFIYWTTLDAHPPYEFVENLVFSSECRTLHLSDVECTFFTLQQNTLLRIASLVKKHPNVHFIIQGDHRPILSFRERAFVNSFFSRWVSVAVLN